MQHEGETIPATCPLIAIAAYVTHSRSSLLLRSGLTLDMGAPHSISLSASAAS